MDHALVVSDAETADDILRCRHGVHREGKFNMSPWAARYMSDDGPHLVLKVRSGAGDFWQQYFRNFYASKDQTFLDHVHRVQWCLTGFYDPETWRAENLIYS